MGSSKLHESTLLLANLIQVFSKHTNSHFVLPEIVWPPEIDIFCPVRAQYDLNWLISDWLEFVHFLRHSWSATTTSGLCIDLSCGIGLMSVHSIDFPVKFWAFCNSFRTNTIRALGGNVDHLFWIHPHSCMGQIERTDLSELPTDSG